MERCAFAFAPHLPPDMPVLSNPLSAISSNAAPTAAVWLPDLAGGRPQDGGVDARAVAEQGLGGLPARAHAVAADPNSPAARAARLDTDPLQRRAPETLFRHRALSERDLNAIGGGLLIVDWAAFVDRAASDGLLQVQMNFGPDGKVYRLIE